ncbi:hypothetical protein [Acetivibrio cellulolyticus]|uniref:hypothetical protein n=1 Tax=Acetivibrio cellulolyticus TaxID=35830 RepID=UPI0001E2BDCC|nr:hypothetical protein [Acetivibrio cellulolyticus]
MFRDFTFNCTSVKLKDYLMRKGFEYFNVFINKEGWTIWKFAKTPKFNQALKEWSENRKQSIS